MHIIPDPSCILLPPRNVQCAVEVRILKSIAMALSTQFHLPVTDVRKLLQVAVIEEWGKVCRVDSEEGDTIQMSKLCGDGRNCGGNVGVLECWSTKRFHTGVKTWLQL